MAWLSDKGAEGWGNRNSIATDASSDSSWSEIEGGAKGKREDRSILIGAWSRQRVIVSP